MKLLSLISFSVLLQINLTREEQKSGLSEEDYQLLRTQLASYLYVRVEGRMVIAKATDKPEETRPTFARGYQLFCQLQVAISSATCTTLSMGMTHDYWIAIEEGANSVRLGTALSLALVIILLNKKRMCK